MSTNVVTGSSLRQAFGDAIVEEASRGIEFTVFSADCAGGTGVQQFRELFPDRHIECGIAEQGMVGVACGYQAGYGKPVLITGFATFLMRSWEIFRLSAAYSNRNVKIVMSHLGIDSGPDGASCQELSYIACWRSIPNAIVLAPASGKEMSQAVRYLLTTPGPMVLLTGRSPVRECLPPDYQFYFNRIQPVAGSGSDCLIFATGNEVSQAVEAAEILGNGYGVEVTVYNVSTLQPIDTEGIAYLSKKSPLWLTVEDHSIRAGLFGAIAEAAVQLPRPPRIVPVGMEEWGESGSAEELRAKYGLDGPGIARRVLEVVAK